MQRDAVVSKWLVEVLLLVFMLPLQVFQVYRIGRFRVARHVLLLCQVLQTLICMLLMIMHAHHMLRIMMNARVWLMVHVLFMMMHAQVWLKMYVLLMRHVLLLSHVPHREVGRCRIQTRWFIHVLIVLHALLLHVHVHLYTLLRHKRRRRVPRRQVRCCHIQTEPSICALMLLHVVLLHGDTRRCEVGRCHIQI